MNKLSPLNKKIKLLRSSMELNQREFAKIMNIAQSRIPCWETGKGKPNANRMKLLIKLGKQHNVFFTIEDAASIGRGDYKKKSEVKKEIIENG